MIYKDVKKQMDRVIDKFILKNKNLMSMKKLNIGCERLIINEMISKFSNLLDLENIDNETDPILNPVIREEIKYILSTKIKCTYDKMSTSRKTITTYELKGVIERMTGIYSTNEDFNLVLKELGLNCLVPRTRSYNGSLNKYIIDIDITLI